MSIECASILPCLSREQEAALSDRRWTITLCAECGAQEHHVNPGACLRCCSMEDPVEVDVMPVPDEAAVERVLAALMKTNSPDNRAAVLAALMEDTPLTRRIPPPDPAAHETKRIGM